MCQICGCRLLCKTSLCMFYGTEESEVILLYKHLLWQWNDIKGIIETYCELRNECTFLCEV